MLFLTYWELNEGMSVAGTGFFKYTRTAPAQPVQEALAQTGEMLKALGA